MKFKKIPPIESVVQPKKVLRSPSKLSLIIDRIVTKLTESVTHERRVRSMQFQVQLSNRMRNAAETVLCFPGKVPLNIC
jgi:hypothetical protein